MHPNLCSSFDALASFYATSVKAQMFKYSAWVSAHNQSNKCYTLSLLMKKRNITITIKEMHMVYKSLKVIRFKRIENILSSILEIFDT